MSKYYDDILYSDIQKDEEEEEVAAAAPVEVKKEPSYGSIEWIYYWADVEGSLPTPINISITGSIKYSCPELKWYNFDIYPHKIKLLNTGYTVIVGGKWKTERPYLLGGPLRDKHVLSQVHFHWGPNMMGGCEHTVDNVRHPGEMHVLFFRSEYLTQEEALKHEDGVVMFCYMIQYGINPDPRLQWVIDGFPRIKEATTATRIGPLPMSQLIPMFFEDYFLYWGNLHTNKGDDYAIRWLIPRVSLFASLQQMTAFRKLWDVWDLPHKGTATNVIEERAGRHIFFITPHWNLYKSLLPLPHVLPEPSISEWSEEYKKKPWMLPPQNVEQVDIVELYDETKESPDDSLLLGDLED